jgi:hypothetical protein
MTAGSTLFGRKWRVTLGTLAIDSQRVAFRVEKTLAPQPNKAEVRVWNLTKSHIQGLENLAAGKVPIPVQIEAGYQSATSVLFTGELRHVVTTREGPDLVTTVGSGDGESAFQTSRINVSIRPNTTTDQALKMIAAALGVSKGNLSSAAVKLRLAGVGNLFSNGTVFCGSASREMTQICRSCGLTWSIQNGELQLLPIGKALDASAIDLSPETGLIGSPSLDVKGKLAVRMLMIPDVFPGRKLVLTSERLSGNYRVEASVHSGDSHGQEWYVDAEGKAL